MSKSLTISEKKDVYNRIKRFMMHSDITLTSDEENILTRWIACDALMRMRKHDEDSIVKEMQEQFSISPFTARRDIQQAQRLFSSARQSLKSYFMPLHLERIDKDIEELRKRMFFTKKNKEGEDELSSIDSKEVMALAKLHDAYTYAFNSMPEETSTEKMPPPIFHFILAPGQTIEKPMQLDDAIERADEIILKQGKNGVYSINGDSQE